MINRCEVCRGKKEILALGGMMRKCNDCKGIGYVKEAIPEPKAACNDTKASIDRRSREYKESIAKIMTDKGVSRSDAITMFDEEFTNT